MSKTDKTEDLVLSEPLAEASLVQSTPVHIPGMALETEADRDAREGVADEPVADTKVPQPVGPIDTRTPEGNLATRDNIVREPPAFVSSWPAAEPVTKSPIKGVDPADPDNGLTPQEDVDASRKRDARASS